ncbi:MAG: ATP-binding protein [Gemmatimonadota bacterium]
MEAASSPTWPGPRPWVGREALLEALAADLARGVEGGGRAVFIEGPPGSGRTTLLHRFANAATYRGKALSAAFCDAADPDASAWSQVASQLTRRDRLSAALKRSASGWVGLIPLVGGVLEATIETRDALKGEAERPPEETSDAAVAQVRMLLSLGAQRPRLILMDNLDAGDTEEFAGAAALVQRLKGVPLVFVAAARAGAGGRTRDLMLEADRLGIAAHHEIPPLSFEDAMRAVTTAVGSPPPEAWEAWWRDHFDGTPARLWRLLGQAHAAGALSSVSGRWTWSAAPPASAVGPPQAAALPGVSAEQADLLRTAASLGARFHADEFAARVGSSTEDLDDALHGLVRAGVLTIVDTVERDAEFVDVLEFVDPPGRRAWLAG